MNAPFERVAFAIAFALCSALAYPAHAKPIAFADGTTATDEYK